MQKRKTRKGEKERRRKMYIEHFFSRIIEFVGAGEGGGGGGFRANQYSRRECSLVLYEIHTSVFDMSI